jgi:uncharacterized protein HemY
MITVILAEHLAQIFGVEARCEQRRADEIAEHHRKMLTLCTVATRRRRADRRSSHEGRNRLQQLLAMSQHDPELLKVGVGQLGQDLGIDGIVAKRRDVLLQS